MNTIKVTKLELDFKVSPDELFLYTKVPDAVKIIFLKPDSKYLSEYLGQSGRKLAKNGFSFYFTRKIAEELIEKKIAKEVN